MAEEIYYDDTRLQQLFAELEPKRRLQALRGGFRKTANKVRKVAINNLRSSLSSNKDLEKGVRAIPYKKKAAGFRVTVGTKKANKNGKGEAGFHTNKRGLKKPVLIWAELGTKDRKTKGNGGRRAKRRRAAHRTGRMRTYGFMDKTQKSVSGWVSEDMHKMVADNVLRVAQKYGCK